MVGRLQGGFAETLDSPAMSGAELRATAHRRGAPRVQALSKWWGIVQGKLAPQKLGARTNQFQIMIARQALKGEKLGRFPRWHVIAAFKNSRALVHFVKHRHVDH